MRIRMQRILLRLASMVLSAALSVWPILGAGLAEVEKDDPVSEERNAVQNEGTAPESAQDISDSLEEDAESQDWYDRLYEEAMSYVPPKGVVEGTALKVKGQKTLGEVEREVILALESAVSEENEMISDEGKFNILLLGIDARPGEASGRSDTMILCSIDVEQNTVKLVSFMRDLYVSIPEHNPNRLNSAYYWGGSDLLFRTLAKNFGVTVEHYIAVDFSMLSSLIDQIGGLEIYIEDEYFVDRINAVIKQDNKVLGLDVNDGLVQGAGLQTLTGKQAQAYARFRYGARSGGDWARTGRQREVLMKIFEKVAQMSIMEISQLAMQNIDSVETDLSLFNLIQLAPVALQLKDANFEEMRVPGDGLFRNETVNGMAVLLPSSKQIIEELRTFLE